MRCPACDEEIPAKSKTCPECGEKLSRKRPAEDDGGDDGGVSTVIPYKNGRALAAYYLGVFGLIPGVGLLLGPAALLLGILGIAYAKKNPKAKGIGHAIVGVVLGTMELVFNLGAVILILLGGVLAASSR